MRKRGIRAVGHECPSGENNDSEHSPWLIGGLRLCQEQAWYRMKPQVSLYGRRSSSRSANLKQRQ